MKSVVEKHNTRRYMLVFLVACLGILSAATSYAADEIGFSVIKTASSAGAQEAMVVSSGSLFKRRHLAQNVVLISHPKGDILIDTGLGENIEEQFEENGFFDQQLFSYTDHNPAIRQLKQAGYDLSRLKCIVPTHLHWDHASGIEDFPNVPLWVQKAEYDQAMAGAAPAFLHSQMDAETINWQFIALAENEYEGFKKSLDIYGDGSVVLVDISGHSAGQVGIFLTISSGKRFFFIGDTTWTIKGVIDNAERPAFLSWLVQFNWDDDKNLTQIQSIHDLSNRNPALTIVPAHDELVAAELPKFPNFLF
ncbi:MBL fold metallo-hydrolase [Alkalimarinus alittae]|uniref:MBL fold metallo-hydrolase n=1 Tax=Alkalimarinus alittae TaxID=2961619 RepID=A0ABY6N1V2_9ALTE|nr:MBL fold metallo-hydrolase [Alkalimarinus alittae]UZE95987.1 MBL fold metallo-hydrolase [Alkalimarinus alittae]